jgi:hypothetical protein
MKVERVRRDGVETAPPRQVTIGKPEDWEPKGETSLKPAGGSESRAFNNVLLNAAASTVWLPSALPEQAKDDRLSAVIHAMLGFQPQDEIEGMIAAQAVAMHLASMECFRRAMIPDQPFEAATCLRKDGASLARGMTEMVAALDRKRGKSNQTVRVEHVTVQAGGQAIVGNVVPSAPGGGLTDGTREKPHAPAPRLAHNASKGTGGTALWSADPERTPVPIAGDGERQV